MQFPQPLDLVTKFGLGSGKQDIKLEPAPALQRRAGPPFIYDRQRGDFPNGRAGLRTGEDQFELTIDRAQVVFEELEVGEQGDESGAKMRYLL